MKDTQPQLTLFHFRDMDEFLAHLELEANSQEAFAVKFDRERRKTDANICKGTARGIRFVLSMYRQSEIGKDKK